MSNRTKGIICIVLSALCFALMNMFVRLSGDLPSLQKSFFRNLVAFVFALVIMLKNHQKFEIGKGNFKYLLLRAVCGTIGIIGNFYAVDHLAQSDAAMLNKMSPFFVLIFSYLLLKEKLTPVQIGAVCVAFAGSMFIVKPTFANLNLGASLAGFVGGLGAGFAYTMVRIMGKRGVKSTTIVLFFSAFSCLVTLPALVFFGKPMSWAQLLCLLGAGLAATGGQFGITQAYCYAAGRDISVYDYTQIIFSAIIGYVVFQQLPDGYSFLGYALIIGAAVLMFFYQKGHDRSLREETT